MTQTKHTPWFQHRNYVTNKQSFAIEDNGMRIGETPDFVIEAENEDQARVIAAAPELLEALLKCVEPIEPGEDCTLNADTYNFICAAIAKATGEA